MKFRSMIWLAGAAALMLVAGNALAQDAKARRAERKAKASRSGDDREEEEEHPAR